MGNSNVLDLSGVLSENQRLKHRFRHSHSDAVKVIILRDIYVSAAALDRGPTKNPVLRRGDVARLDGHRSLLGVLDAESAQKMPVHVFQVVEFELSGLGCNAWNVLVPVEHVSIRDEQWDGVWITREFQPSRTKPLCLVCPTTGLEQEVEWYTLAVSLGMPIDELYCKLSDRRFRRECDRWFLVNNG